MEQYFAGQNAKQFEEKLRPFISQIRLEGNLEPTKAEQDHAFLIQLVYWFRRSFKWDSDPRCEGCGSETINQGLDTPIPSELQYGAFRVELYSCRYCLRTTRCPRYNDPLKLLETRSGRCGEWANCFTLYCRAFGYATRLVVDFTDHIWTECFSEHLGRWVHLDPCESVYDYPLLYEISWSKKLDYTFGLANDGVYDIAKRYTRKWPEVLTRRTLITESALAGLFCKLTRESRRSFPPEVISALEDRDRREVEALERDLHPSSNFCS